MRRITIRIDKSILKFFFAICLCQFIITRGESPNFAHLWVEDGLSQSTVFSIYKDQKGFIWFGTRRGLNRYDGYEFVYYTHDVKDKNCISSNVIYSIIGDKKDNLIIQTDNSLNYYNRYLEKFSVIHTNEFFWNFIKDRGNNIWTCSASGIYLFNDQGLVFDSVEQGYPFTDLYDLSIDKKNIIWLTSMHGVISYNPTNRKFINYELDDYTQSEKENFFIETDSDGKIWICLRNGELLYYSEEIDSFVKLKYNNSGKNLIVSSFGRGLDNDIIIGTDGNGIIQIDARTNEVKKFNQIPDVETSLSSNTFYSIYADKKMGILWLGSYMGGIDYYCKYDKGFKFIYHEPYNKKSIINSNIRSLLVDNKKNIWIGTRQGISVIDSTNNVFSEYTQKALFDAGITNSIITNLWQDSSGYIWVCSYKGGVLLFDPSFRKFIEISQVYPNISLPVNLGVFDVMEDSKQNFWIASDEGTYLFPLNKKGFVFDVNFSKKIIEDRAGRIFIGTAYNGLLQVDHALQIFHVSFDSLSNSDKIKRINTLFEDSEGNIWIGMGGSGIIKYNPSNNTTRHFTSDNDLSDNNIAGIVEDLNGIIWITTYSGLGRYSQDKGRFKNIYLERGIKGKEFNPNSIEITDDGTIYAGSINGLLKFNTFRYRENPILPDVIFTQLYVNDEKVMVGQINSPIEQAIMFSENIRLKYFQSSIVLKFTAPEYFLGDKVKFYYRFGENNGTWNDLGNTRSLNIVDLMAGDYVLSIRAANSDGYSKTQGTRLFIHVDPPPWKTTFAYILYFLFITGLLILSRYFIKSKLKLKYQVLLHKADKEKQAEINQTRIKLFTDVSHEIGTSLTLLNVPLETLNNIESDDIKKHYLAIINKNVQRLIHLVKRIIDLRKIETGNMLLLTSQDDIINFVKTVCINFESIARRKNISFIHEYPVNPVFTWFDKEKIEYILFSLLSNAFKFEPEDGRVLISVKKDYGIINGDKKKLILIKINNKGSFIPPDKAENIFKRFYQGSGSDFGSGIGLSLTKSYVEIHKGEICFLSDTLQGVTFEVKIPYGDKYFEKNEKITDASKYEIKTPYLLDSESEITHVDSEPEADERNKILIVEDNVELQQLFKEQFSGKFEIIEAKDEEEGILKAKYFQPDIVIIDLNLSNGERLELCNSIKKDIEIGHIPVIILTANEDIEEKIKGMESGADAYINKPFSIYYLLSVIRNLIDLRKKLKKKYNIGMDIDDKINITSMDENFLEKAYIVLEKNLDNTQFGIPEFINQLGISKYMLYSRIKMLTGQTPNEFIITFKLKKAAHILKNKNISDIDLYYRLGFNDVSYFRKCFKKQYGITPTQFVKSNKFLKGEKSSR